MSISATPESLPYDDADARLGGALSDWFEGAGSDPGYEEVLFFDGDLTLDGDFEAAIDELRGADAEGDVEMVVVTGDLTVNGPIALYWDRPGLYVGGHTKAETLEAGECEIYIHDGTFTHLVYGYYNHGRLETGTVDTPWVIEFDHDMIVYAPGARWVDAYGDAEHADFDSAGIADSFVPEVVDEDGGLLVPEFINRLQAGLPVLRPGARTAAESVSDDVSRALADRAEHLDLTGRKLQAFPTEVLQMPWLRTLILDGNYGIGELPEALGTLTLLEHLSVCDCGLTALPESIGDLAALRVLRVAGNRSWNKDGPEFTLPASVGRLTALEELDICRLSAEAGTSRKPELTRFVLPDGFGGLVALRRLFANGTHVVFPDSAHGMTGLEEVSMSGGLRTFPEAVTLFPNLRRLDLSSNGFDVVPDSLLRLTRLEELDLDGSLCRVRDPLPDLGRLPALRILGLSGRGGHTDVREPAHVFLRELFGMDLTGLEELRIDRWHRNGEGRLLEPEDLAGIGMFRRLRTVDLSFNKLKDLPADFDTLPDLAVVNLAYNLLPEEVRDRITAAHPNAQIDFES